MPLAALTVCMTLSQALVTATPPPAAVLDEVNAIWQPHGVAVRLGTSEEGCDRLVVVKSDVEARPEDASSAAALAWVPFVEGRARRVVFVRIARARALLDALNPGPQPIALTGMLLPKFLGRILAHELGHILLNTREHQDSGLMRPLYQARDVLRESPLKYTLSARLQDRLRPGTGVAP